MKDDDGILNRHSLLTARVYSDGHQKRLTFSYVKIKKNNLFGNLVLNKTCDDNRLKQTVLLSALFPLQLSVREK